MPATAGHALIAGTSRTSRLLEKALNWRAPRLDTAARGYASSEMPDQRPAIAIGRLVGLYADDATEVQMHIGSVLLVIWLVIGGIAAGQRGDYKGPVGCSRASTIAVTILAGPFNYAGVNPNINCTVQHPSN